MAALDYPLVQVGPLETRTTYGGDHHSVRVEVPMRIVSVAGLVPMVTWPCHDDVPSGGDASILTRPLERRRR